MSDKNVLTVAFGQSYDLVTGKKHELRLPPDWMTITFLMPSGAVDIEYPRYELKSADGAYEKSLTAKDDMQPGDKYLQLKFENLLAGKKYTLTVFHDAQISRVIFDKVPYNEVVDQDRAMHEDIAEHKYGEFEFEEVSDKMFEDLVDEGAA